MARECHFLHGQNHVLKMMNDQRPVGEYFWLGEKAGALDEVISRRMEDGGWCLYRCGRPKCRGVVPASSVGYPGTLVPREDVRTSCDRLYIYVCSEKHE